MQPDKNIIALLKNAGALCTFEPMKVLPSPQASGKNQGRANIPRCQSPAVLYTPVFRHPRVRSHRKQSNRQHWIPRCILPDGYLQREEWFSSYSCTSFSFSSSQAQHLTISTENTSLLDGDSPIIGIPLYFIPIFIGILLIVPCSNLLSHDLYRNALPLLFPGRRNRHSMLSLISSANPSALKYLLLLKSIVRWMLLPGSDGEW